MKRNVLPVSSLPRRSYMARRYWLLCGLLVLLVLLTSRQRGPENTAQAALQENAAAEIWSSVAPGAARLTRRDAASLPRAYGTWQLSATALGNVLRQAPREFSDASKTRQATLALPLPDGSLSRFRILASPVLEPELAARFPEIQTYVAQGVDDPAATARLSWTPQGFNAIILQEQGTSFVEPVVTGDKEYYLAYALADAPDAVSHCGVNGAVQEAARQTTPTARRRQPNFSLGGTLRQYRLALAATGEYTQTYGGGTVNGALAAITTIVNSINAIYERDLDVRMVLIANETAVIFTDPASDGYTSGNIAALIDENRARLNAVLGAGTYDVGHVIDGHTIAGGGFSFAGLAYVGVVCNSNFKGGGASILDGVQPTQAIATYILAHEIGHEFGAAHSFNTTAGGCGPARTATAAYEPASGATIMAYRFTCGVEDTRSSSMHFHLSSIQQIQNYLGSAGCGTNISNGNRPPVANAGPDYTIPANTPFRLTASGSDPDGEAVTYSWEQFDLGNPSPPLADDGTRPLFRSSDPASNPTRIFPRLSDILGTTTSISEMLPTTTRTLTFHVTARDNHAGGGGLADDETLISVRAGNAFAVTQPTLGTTWAGGTAQTITWDVANTNAAPIGVASVRILLSNDGGLTFPYVLSEGTPNDGTETITLPNLTGGVPRVMIEAAGNVFFNISQSFTITNGTATVQFNLSNGTSVAESNTNGLSLNVTRSGNTALPATVNYTTTDGTAEQRTDYIVTSGQLNFAANETLKTIIVPVVNDDYDENSETFRLTLSNPNGVAIAGENALTLTLEDDDTGLPTRPNPLETGDFFVRQQYYDFLNRIPDAGGFAYWTDQIAQCGTDANCLRSRRVSVSAAFFIELEFQESGAFVYRLYKAAYGEAASYRPTYIKFTPDRARVVGGTDLAASKLSLANDFVQRPEFLARYPQSLNSVQFVDAILQTVEQGGGGSFTIVQRASFIADVNTGGRGLMLRNLADNQDFTQAVFNRAFVLMQYFGYLRRDPDQGGYDFWLGVLNQQPANARGMVCAFITSAEHQQRFSSVISRTNNECGPGI